MNRREQKTLLKLKTYFIKTRDQYIEAANKYSDYRDLLIAQEEKAEKMLQESLGLVESPKPIVEPETEKVVEPIKQVEPTTQIVESNEVQQPSVGSECNHEFKDTRPLRKCLHCGKQKWKIDKEKKENPESVDLEI